MNRVNRKATRILAILAFGLHPEIEKAAREGNASEQMMLDGAFDAVVEEGMAAEESGKDGGGVDVELRG